MPFIVKVPGIVKPGQSSDILINHVDMWPRLPGWPDWDRNCRPTGKAKIFPPRLFDMDNDPYETKNLAYDPAFRDVVVEEASAIRSFLGRYGIAGCTVTKADLVNGKGPLPYPSDG